MAGWDDTTGVVGIEKEKPGKRDRAYLIVLAGGSVGEMYKLEREVSVIGRGQHAAIRVLDEGISREHARIVVRGDRIVLEDLGSTNGTFCNGARVDSRELSDGDKILIGSTTILKFTYHDNLDESFQRQMFESALRDGLTKTFNKKYMLDRLDSEVAYALRHRTPLSFILFDIDHFKKINDTHGHPAGDYVLAALADTLTGALRIEDAFARFGGEEFAVICRGIEASVGQIIAERLRRLTESTSFVHDGKTISVTISVGLAALPDTAAKTSTELIAAADAALYEAKNTGRNRVCLRRD